MKTKIVEPIDPNYIAPENLDTKNIDKEPVKNNLNIPLTEDYILISEDPTSKKNKLKNIYFVAEGTFGLSQDNNISIIFQANSYIGDEYLINKSGNSSYTFFNLSKTNIGYLFALDIEFLMDTISYYDKSFLFLVYKTKLKYKQINEFFAKNSSKPIPSKEKVQTIQPNIHRPNFSSDKKNKKVNNSDKLLRNPIEDTGKNDWMEKIKKFHKMERKSILEIKKKEKEEKNSKKGNVTIIQPLSRTSANPLSGSINDVNDVNDLNDVNDVIEVNEDEEHTGGENILNVENAGNNFDVASDHALNNSKNHVSNFRRSYRIFDPKVTQLKTFKEFQDEGVHNLEINDEKLISMKYLESTRQKFNKNLDYLHQLDKKLNFLRNHIEELKKNFNMSKNSIDVIVSKVKLNSKHIFPD